MDYTENNRKSLTIDDIAEMAGVSRSTVSRVLNNNPNVSDARRKKVLKVIEENNFVPNAMARNLGTGLTRTIGLLVGDITNQYYSEVIKGAEEMATELGYFLLICLTRNIQSEHFYIEEMIRRRTSGAIVVSTSIQNSTSAEKLANAMSVLSIQAELPNIPVLYHLDSNNKTGMLNITRHLIQLGHKKIAYITTLPDTETLRERKAGFLEACHEHGITLSNRYIRSATSKSDITVIINTLLTEKDPPTAICCCNDYTAGIAFHTIRLAGIKIPEEISLTGYDDLPIATLMEPMLTTVRQPIREMGRTAVKLLVDSLNHPQTSPVEKCVRFPSELVLRYSVIPPRK